MEYVDAIAGREDEIGTLFADVFTASEGAGEGMLIGQLARDLMATTPANDLRFFGAMDARDGLIGAIIFTRITFSDDPRVVFLLAPVAVATARQKHGVGHGLISHGLERLGAEAVEVALTYGDPNYYARVGFAPISATDIPPPKPLSFPHGWLGQSLSGKTLDALPGPSRCAPALNDPSFW